MLIRFQTQVRNFHRIYKMKKDDNKYSIIPLTLFVSGMVIYSTYRHRDEIKNYIKNKCN